MAAVQRQGNFPQQQQQQGQQQGRQQSQPPQGQDGRNVGPAGVLKVAAIDPASAAGGDSRRTKSGRFTMAQLRHTDGIVPLQYGTNQFDSQKLMTSFGTPRDVRGKHLKRIWELEFPDEEIGAGGNFSGQQAESNGFQQGQGQQFHSQKQGQQFNQGQQDQFQQQGQQQFQQQQRSVPQQGGQQPQQGYNQQPQQQQFNQQQKFNQQPQQQQFNQQPQQQQFNQQQGLNQQRVPQQGFQQQIPQSFQQPQQGFQGQGFNQQQQALKSPPAFR